MFEVAGTPVPQGSMVVQRGRVRHQDSDRLTNWREAIRGACLKDMRDVEHSIAPPMFKPWHLGVDLEIWFTYKPKKQAESDVYKASAPDLDKLVRAVLDALTGTLYEDDRQVCHIEAHKGYGTWESIYDGGTEETHLNVNARLLNEGAS